MPPREREFVSWTYALLWSGLIFVTVPFVRVGVGYVRGQWGIEVFTYAVAAVVISAAAAALFLTRRKWSLASCGWVVGLAGLVIYLTLGLAESTPVEAVHYVQYGVLSLLLYRAFVHRIRDYSIYAAVMVAGTLVGMIDETIQWLTPGRVFAVSDIGLNFTAVALVQVALAAGIRPRLVRGWPDGASLARLCYLSVVAVGYLGLCHLNTPDRIAWYTADSPLLGFIDPNRSIMVEYGYMHGDPDGVHFRSRLTAEELRRQAKERAEEASRILDRDRDRRPYREFLVVYSPLTDPFLHEARVHLFRRDVHLERARTSEGEQQQKDFATAYWENRILQDYFGPLLSASSYAWPEALEAEVRDKADTARAYDSWVSRHLIVAFGPNQLSLLFLMAVAALVVMGVYFGRRSRAGEAGRIRAARQDAAP